MTNILLRIAALLGLISITVGDRTIAADGAKLRYTCRETRIGHPEYKGKKLVVLEQIQSEPFLSTNEAVSSSRFTLNLYEGEVSQDNEKLLKNMPTQYLGDAKYIRQIDQVSFRSDRNRLMETNVVSVTMKRHKLDLSRFVGIKEQFYVDCNETIIQAP